MSMLRSGTVQANGQELYFEVHGEGPPLVLVMGIGYDATLWTLAQVPALSRMFQVVIFDIAMPAAVPTRWAHTPSQIWQMTLPA